MDNRLLSRKRHGLLRGETRQSLVRAAGARLGDRRSGPAARLEVVLGGVPYCDSVSLIQALTELT